MPKTVRVTAAHRRPQRPPITVRAGDDVQVVKRDEKWPAFVMVVAPVGGSGWVPLRYLTAAEGMARVIHDYDTTELDADPGDILTILERDDESGWHWCEDVRGQRGWIPTASIAESS